MKLYDHNDDHNNDHIHKHNNRICKKLDFDDHPEPRCQHHVPARSSITKDDNSYEVSKAATTRLLPQQHQQQPHHHHQDVFEFAQFVAGKLIQDIQKQASSSPSEREKDDIALEKDGNNAPEDSLLFGITKNHDSFASSSSKNGDCDDSEEKPEITIWPTRNK
jgi:hypothetical protein